MSKPSSSFLPEAGERGLVVGMTGSGKTKFVGWMLRRLEQTPVVIYDTKDEDSFPKFDGAKIVHTFEEVLEAVDDEEIDYIVVRPPLELLDDPEELDRQYLRRHYHELRGIPAYVDEIDDFHKNGRGFSGLSALLKRGRSRGITFIYSTQRPAWISRACFTEATKVFVFYLGDKQDRKRIGDVVPGFADAPPPPPFHFYYYRSGEREFHLYEPIKLEDKFNSGYVDKGSVSEDHPKDPDPSATNPGTSRIWV